MRLLMFVAVALFLVACSGPEEDNTPPQCTPGRTEACPCPDGSTGTQSCSSDGEFGMCACAGMPEDMGGDAEDQGSTNSTTPPVDMADSPDMTSDMSQPDMSTPPVDMAPVDQGPDCTCDVESECCDGCQPIAGTCGDACSPDAVCEAGACVPGEPLDCALEPAQECKVGACDPVNGCVVEDAPDGTRCGGNAGMCDQGQCVPDPNCSCRDDAGPCCQGCQFVTRGVVCQEDWVAATCPSESVPGEVSISERTGSILCTGVDEECERKADNSNFQYTFVSRSCGHPDVAICTPGEGVDYKGCGVK